MTKQSAIGKDADSLLTPVTITGIDTGDLLYYNGSAWVNLGAGADGDVLTATGVSAAPAWETPSAGGGVDQWIAISGAATYVSGTEFTCDSPANDATMIRGRPIRYTTNSVVGYGIIVNVVDGGDHLHVTISGMALNAAGITVMAYGDMSRVVVIPVLIPGLFEDATDTTLITNDLGMVIQWAQGRAYCVRARFRCRVADGGTAVTANASVGGSNVLGTAATLSAGATWYPVDTVGQNVDGTNYATDMGETIEVAATKAGTGDAQELTAELTFVLGP